MRIKKREIFDWIRIGSEYVAIVVLYLHLLPDQLIENWKENGLASIILLTVTLLLSLVFRFISDTEKARLLEGKEDQISQLKAENEEQERLFNEEKIKLKRLSVYGEMFPLLNESFSQLHDTLRADLTEIEYRHAFKEFCNKLAVVFSKITNSDCHVCIKIPVAMDKNPNKISRLKVRTFVRDSLRPKRDAVDAINIDHYINLNTDFEQIFLNIRSEKGRYFFSNNLIELANYKNSSFLAKGTSNPFFHEKEALDYKEKNWPLLYKSTITAPICPGIAEQRSTGTFFGFLCVDCGNAGPFIERIDAEIVAGCADGLYNPFRQFIIKRNSNKN